MATARNIGELLKLIEQLRREVSRLKTLNGRVEAVEKIAHHYHSRLPGMYAALDTEDYLEANIENNALLTKDGGALANITQGVNGRPLVSGSPPTYAQLQSGAIASEQICGILGYRHIQAGSIGNRYLWEGVVEHVNMDADSVGTSQLIDGAVTNAKLGSGAVQTANISDLAVGTNQIADGAVTNAKIASETITGDRLVMGTVTEDQLAVGSVTSDQIQAGAVKESELDTGAVTNAKIGADAVNGSKIADNSIDSEHYVDGSIDAVHLANSYHLASNFHTTRPGNESVAIKTQGSDGLIDRSFLPTYGEADIEAAAITEAKLAAGSVTAGKIASGAVDGTKMAAGSIDTTQLAASSVSRAKLSSPADLENTQTHIIRRSGSWTSGQAIRLYLDTTDNMTRIRVPAGKTLEVLQFHGNMVSGASAGTWKFRGFVREFLDDQTTSGSTTHYFNDEDDWGGTDTSHYYFYGETWDGTTPLASVTGGATKTVMFGMENHADSPGTTTSDNVGMTVVYRIV